ncbi:hypothetical protein [Kitasatospora sp. NPDC001527]|uniref:hypothetical protein n=1 Tax=Kitasatospora sp. NPDC001527 TaxID=3154519 RepID=UPI0033199AA0
MADTNGTLTVAEMRRRRRERDAVENRVKDLTDALVVNTRSAAADAAAAKAAADTAAAEALALAVRLHGSADDVAELTDIPLAEVERAVKSVTAARVKELREELRAKAETKVAGTRRRGTPAAAAGAEAEGGDDSSSADLPGQDSTGPDGAAEAAAAASVS